MELKLIFLYGKYRTYHVTCPEKYEVISNLLEDHSGIGSCERLKNELANGLENYPAFWEMGCNSCYLTIGVYKQIILKSYWWDEFLIIRTKEFLKLINAWEDFIRGNKIKIEYTLEIKEMLRKSDFL